MEDLSLHILDIAENSINAGAKHIEIKIVADSVKDLLTIEITDDGIGMNEEVVKNVTDPFYTSRTTRKIGLGLPMLKEAAEASNGKLEIISQQGKGTKVTASFQLSHIDRKPIGNMSETIVALLSGNPNTGINYIETSNNSKFIFDSSDIKNRIKDVKINSPEVLIFIKNYINGNSIISNK
ncbi:MAG: ATP-binding protein [Bacteroidota bacterium]|nr:ATP-binding protein [Bacteroidota bacterium]